MGKLLLHKLQNFIALIVTITLDSLLILFVAVATKYTTKGVEFIYGVPLIEMQKDNSAFSTIYTGSKWLLVTLAAIYAIADIYKTIMTLIKDENGH